MNYGYVPPPAPHQNWLLLHKGLVAAIVGAVAGGVIVAGVATRGSSGPPAYLASSSRMVEFVTWQPVGNGIQGTIADDSLTRTAPSETVSVQSVPFSGSINGSTVTMTVNGGFLVGTRTLSATLNGGALSISFIGSSGAFQTATLLQSSASACNAAVAALHKNANHANLLAEQAQAEQQQQQANAQAKQQAQNDVATLQQDASLSSGSNLSGDVSSLNGDASTAAADLHTTQSDASQGPGGQCINASTTVYNDAATTLYNDQVTTLANDVTTLQQDIGTVKQDIATLRRDLQTLQSDGVSAPADASSAVSTAKSAISSAVAKANRDISAVNNDVAQGYQIANGLAKGACAGQGPGNPPSLEPSISP